MRAAARVLALLCGGAALSAGRNLKTGGSESASRSDPPAGPTHRIRASAIRAHTRLLLRAAPNWFSKEFLYQQLWRFRIGMRVAAATTSPA